MEKVQFRELSNSGDTRGVSFTIPSEALCFLARVADVHVVSVLPGAVRGNHFHKQRREVLIVVHESSWSLHWDEGEGTPIQEKCFFGSGAKVILVETGSSHAVRNTGTRTLVIFELSTEPYDPQETVRRVIT